MKVVRNPVKKLRMGAESSYLSSARTQLPSFQGPVLGYATASTLVSGSYPWEIHSPSGNGGLGHFDGWSARR